MTDKEIEIVHRHKQLAKTGFRDSKGTDLEVDGYLPIGVVEQMCICELCQRYLAEKYPIRWRQE